MKTFLLAALSAGWILPLCLAAAAFRKYLELTLIPQITGRGFMTSFPFLQASLVCFVISCCWLATVIAFWVIHLRRRQQKFPDTVSRQAVKESTAIGPQ
jgi:hypothetical protein